MRGILFAAVIGFSTTLFAVAGPQEQHLPSPPHETHNMAAMDCPMKSSPADLSIEDTSDGIRLTFTTKSGDVDKVRRRVEAFSRLHGASATKDVHGNIMRFVVTYEAVPGGARLTLTPRDLLQLEEFRAKVREHSAQKENGECARMESMMPGMMNSMKDVRDPRQPDHEAHHPPAEKKQ